MMKLPEAAMRDFQFSSMARISPDETGSLRIPSVAPIRYQSIGLAMQSERKIMLSPFGAADGFVR